MIKGFKKILFFADGAEGELAAARRAFGIAVQNQAEFTVFGVADEVSTDDVQLRASIKKIQATLIRETELKLDKLIEGITSNNDQSVIPKKMVVPGKDYVAVIGAALAGEADIIIKSVNPKTAVHNAVFGSTDLRLMHYAPCPVMILKPLRRKSWQYVVVAVDPRAKTSQEISLNADLMAMATSVAEIEDADLHVLHVLEEQGTGKPEKLEDEFRELEKSLRSDAERKMEKLTEGYGHISLKEHLLKGKPHTAITRYVHENEADLLVMGSVARSGIPGFFVGNTAEKIMNDVDCSLLVLKPRGWKTPVG